MKYFEMTCACKGKNLDKMLQPSILMLLRNEDLHGFALVQKLAEGPMFNGCEPDPAGVYRYLKKMETSGLLASDWGFDEDGKKPRRVYSITDSGKDCLINWMMVLKEYAVSLKKLAEDIEDVVNK